jgi:urea transporter
MFIDSALRGAAQVVFQSNPISGLFILVALFLQSPFFGLCATIGLVVETGMSMIYRINRSLIRAGLHGYNGILVGCATATFFGMHYCTYMSRSHLRG